MSDVTVVQVEASVVGISFSVNADIFVDPEVASVIVSEEECVTVIGSLTFSRACIGVGVGGTRVGVGVGVRVGVGGTEVGVGVGIAANLS